MGITRAVLGVIAAAGVARLLAPKETKIVVKSAGRTVRAGAKAAKRKAISVTGAAGLAERRKPKTTPLGKRKAAVKVRKAAKRPTRKANR